MAGKPDYSELQRRFSDAFAAVAKQIRSVLNAVHIAFKNLTIDCDCNRRSRRAAASLNFSAARHYANDHIQRHIRWRERCRNDES